MNYLAILVAAVAGMAVGFFWYGPLFGKIWVKLSGFTKEDMEKAQAKGMTKTYVLVIPLACAFSISSLVKPDSLTKIFPKSGPYQKKPTAIPATAATKIAK